MFERALHKSLMPCLVLSAANMALHCRVGITICNLHLPTFWAERAIHSSKQLQSANQHECSTSAASAAQLHYKCSTIALQVQHNCSTIVAQVQRKCSTSAARTYHGQHTELTRHSSNLSVAVLITSLACYHQTLCTYSGAAQGLIIATTHPSLSTLSVSLQPTTQLKEQPITQLKERTITAAYLYQWRCAVIQK